jgi:LPS O-antigen subunit length determinant protein (WzzB/FepE family)
MKMRLIAILFFCMIASPGFAQTVDLTGTWNLAWTPTVNAMSATESTRFNNLPADVRTRIENSFSSRVYSFSSDGTMTATWTNNQAQSETGTWNLSGNTLTLTVNNAPRTYTLQLQGSQLTLTMNDTAGGLFSTLVLIRQ